MNAANVENVDVRQRHVNAAVALKRVAAMRHACVVIAAAGAAATSWSRVERWTVRARP